MKKFAIVNRDDKTSISLATEIRQSLVDNGLAYDELEPDIICVIGGDGTFLSAIHKYLHHLDNVYFTAINSGTLGFFSDYTIQEKKQYIDDIIYNVPTLNSKRLLKISLFSKDAQKDLYAVNEMRIENIIRTQQMDIYINESKLETYRGTGICVSTQVGSTAYNRSLYGSVIEEGLEVMELTEITGIHHKHYRSLGVPIVLSDKNTIRFISDFDETSLLCFDRDVLKMTNIDKVECSLSEKSFKLAHFRKVDYIERLYHLF